jgi:short subunit dehydrogenase-like uncharacterized protein
MTDKTVVVFGATGYTGKLVVAALLAMDVRNVILGGRDEDKLHALAKAHGQLETRIADARRPETLPDLVRGAHVVIDTAGPFIELGEPVVRAAIDAGAHFVDTTGEQAYMARVLERYHGGAKLKKLAVLNAQAFEFALGYCVASLLADWDHELDTIDVFNRVAGFGATRGTQKSALKSLLEEALVRQDGRLVRRGASPVPMRVRMPDSDKTELAVPFPGGEALHLARAHPEVANVTTNLVLPERMALALMGGWSLRSLLKPLSRLGALDPLLDKIDQGPEGPSEADRQSARFKVLARGTGKGRSRGVLATGCDPYGVTGVIAALAAKLLLEGQPLAAGVVSTDQAFGARAFLDRLAPYGVQISRHEL